MYSAPHVLLTSAVSQFCLNFLSSQGSWWHWKSGDCVVVACSIPAGVRGCPTLGVELSRCTRHAVISPHYLPLFQGAFLEGTSHNIPVGPNSVTRAAARSKAILTGHSASLNRNEVPLLRKERDINAGESSAQIGGCWGKFIHTEGEVSVRTFWEHCLVSDGLGSLWEIIVGPYR